MVSGRFEGINVLPVHLAFDVISPIKQHMYLVLFFFISWKRGGGHGKFLIVTCLSLTLCR